jgi:hypothetical protein
MRYLLGIVLALLGIMAVLLALPRLASQPGVGTSTDAGRVTGSAIPDAIDAPMIPMPPARAVALRVLVLDLAAPESPVPVDLLRPNWNAQRSASMIVLGDLAYAIGRFGEFQVVSLSDPPTSPLADWDTSLAAIDQYVYLTAGEHEFRIVDLASGRSTRHPTPGAALAILVQDGYAYVGLLQYSPAFSGYD